MPQYRADFRVDSTLVLPLDAEPIVVQRDNLTSLQIRNQPVDKNGHIPGLDIQVIAQCNEIEEAPYVFRAILAQELDLISFVTNSAFKINTCYRVTEWEPFQVDRKCNVIEKFDPYYPPDPQLEKEYFATIKKINAVGVQEFQKRAIRYFRYGLIGDQPEDQFQNFWLTIEIIASGIKGSEPLNIPCPKCDGVMICNECGHRPMRRPIPKEEIKNIISKIFPKDDAKKIFDELDETRNTLLHGRFDAVEPKVGKPLSELVNLAGFIAWHAVFLSIPDANETYIFGHRDHYTNGVLYFVGNLFFEHKESTAQPADDKIPTVKVEMHVTFKAVPEQVKKNG